MPGYWGRVARHKLFQMLKAGITGGMGSGKSTVAKVFEVLGIPVYYADDAARRLMMESEELKSRLITAFGEEAYNGSDVNRGYLSSIVFNDTAKLTLLNAIIHPATISDANKWMQQQKAPYVLKEAALIFESGSQANLDFIIGVSAPEPLRIQRVMNRDNLSNDDIRARMSKQMDEETKMNLCDYVVINDDHSLVIPQVIKIHEALLATAEKFGSPG